MVTYLFTAILLLGVLAVALYFWQRPSNRKTLGGSEAEPPLLPPTDSRGLFIGTSTDDAITSNIRTTSESSTNTGLPISVDSLIDRAQHNDKTALQDALKQWAVYEQVLQLLIQQADSDAKLLSLVSYVGTNNLPVTKPLAEAFIASWRRAPSRARTPSMLHIAALADDAELYQVAIKTALQAWRDGSLSDISTIELGSLFDGEFWVLSSATRSTGAGFMLKRTLAQARRELEDAPTK